MNGPRFAFLLPNNPYRCRKWIPMAALVLEGLGQRVWPARPYYEQKVKEFKTGVVEDLGARPCPLN